VARAGGRWHRLAVAAEIDPRFRDYYDQKDGILATLQRQGWLRPAALFHRQMH
jgi:hypothetical protein